MDPSNEDLERIGANIRKARKKKGLKLADLAALVGLSAPFLSQLENARVNVNLTTLTKIGAALEMPLARLFAGEETMKVSLLKSEERRWFPLSGQAVESILLKSMSNLEIAIIRLPPGSDSGTPSNHPGNEVCYVTQGSLRVMLDENTVYDLDENDIIHFESNTPHRWENVTGEVTEFIVINTPATY